ncbi:type I-E CRISPR-associated protein Cse1/CasA [Nocardia sp. NBC_00881]|uniref:type I-E CRISPR-associated protein Cse1/CasA n=1 Tax=Nocardia sp. NBC_00881 TaxID=2975995 RepID=UPI0038696522|nr:type I-E CRISPR-associated protein Cse1/CasA [Nocardia sp. NBC_00881]
MTTTAPTFDLLDEPWITVTDHSGVAQEMSLRDVFAHADRFAALGGEVPTQEFAIARLLLAILHRSIRHRRGTAVEIWSQLWDQWPGEDIDHYLVEHRARFQLFHPATPFFQVPGLRSEKDAVSSLDKLIADVPNGAKYFTTRAGRGIERISFAEAARWLVHAHAFDPSGIKTGADGDARVKGGKGYPIGVAWAGGLGGVYLEGANLRETLLLNLVLADPNDVRFSSADLPPWERDPDGPGVRDVNGPSGPVDLFTWQSRRVRLITSSSEVTGVVLCNGDALEPFNKHLLEPMTGWRYSEVQSKKSGEPRHYPAVHSPEKSLWRGLRSLLGDVASSAPLGGRGIAPGVVEWVGTLLDRGVFLDGHPIRLHAVGMHYINNQSIVGDIVDDAISFSAALLASDPRLWVCAVNAVQVAEAAVDELGALAANLTLASGGEPDGARGRAREEGFFALEAPYRNWLRGLDPQTIDYDPSASQWEQTVYTIIRRLGDELITSASQQAWVGRPVRERWMDTSLADERFFQRLRNLLPSVFTQRILTQEGETTDGERADVAW